MSSSQIMQALLALVWRIPILLVYLLGFIFALMRYRRAPKAMRYVAIGCGLLLFNSIANQLIFMLIVRQSPRSPSFGEITMIIQFTSIAFSVVGIGLIILGAFCGRQTDPVGFPVVFDRA